MNDLIIAINDLIIAISVLHPAAQVAIILGIIVLLLASVRAIIWVIDIALDSIL